MKDLLLIFALFFTSNLFASVFPQETNFQVAKTGNVDMYFVGQSADYDNVVSVVFSDTGLASGSLNNHQSTFGQLVSLGSHDSGSFVIFSDLVLNTGNAWFSSSSMNSDGINHIFQSPFVLPDGTNALMIGFEDLKGGGDKDFNDVMYIVTNVDVIPAVPEPWTYLMLLVGLFFLLIFSSQDRFWNKK